MRSRISVEDQPALTAERLRELLSYDPETGVFTWRVERRSGRAKKGDVCRGALAGDHGAKRQIWLDGKNYYQHRLAWLWVYGAWPKHQIDHINGDQEDNRISNLRDVPGIINIQNKHRACKLSHSGLLGVQRNGKYWKAEVVSDGYRWYFGTFKTPEEAHAVYIKAKRWLHPESAL